MNTDFLSSPALNALLARLDYVDLSLVALGIVVLICLSRISRLSASSDLSHVERELSEMRDRVEYLSSSLDLLEGRIAQLEEGRNGLPSPSTGPHEVREEVVVSKPPPVAVVEEVKAPPVVAPPAIERPSIGRGLAKSRSSFLGKIKNLFTGRASIDLSMLDDLEEVLISSDVGVKVTESLIARVKERASESRDLSEGALKALLKDGIRQELLPVSADHRMYQPVGAPMVVLVVGVNGVGKTTTVAKLATKYKGQGKKVLAIAADTFRAAAVQQLNEWGTRSGFEVYSGPENSKPAAVVFDGMVAALERGVDVVLIDTAGRLHTKSNLMQELEGVRNSIKRHVPGAPHETVLVVDGVSGQNALSQAREFNSSTPLTGLVVTKLDGTPKGGIIVAISQELKIPVIYVGVGEKAADLLEFSADDFVSGLVADEGDATGVVSSEVAA